MSTNRAKLEALLKLIQSSTQDAIAEYERAGGEVPAIDSTEPHPLDNALDQVALKNALRILEGACAQLCTTLAPPSHTVMSLAQEYDFACFRVALREKITDILVDYPDGIHVNDLAKIIQTDPKKLARLMRILATRGCYNEVDADTFANNRVSLILHSSNPVSHLASTRGDACAKAASVLHETMKDPEVAYSEDPERAPIVYANKKEGITGTFFEWMKQEDARRETFQVAMKALSEIAGYSGVLTRYPFEKYSTVVDVGGGIGAFAVPLAEIHTHVKITIQDLPEVLVQSKIVCERDCPEAFKEGRIAFVDLNFLTQAPVKGQDIYYLRNIIHDWPDNEAELILRNVRQALGPHSRVLIHDYVLPQLSRRQAEADAAFAGTALAPEPLLPNYGSGNIRMYHQDLTMWLLFNSKERMLQNSLALATTAGLKLEKVWDLTQTCVLEFSAA